MTQANAEAEVSHTKCHLTNYVTICHFIFVQQTVTHYQACEMPSHTQRASPHYEPNRQRRTVVRISSQ